MRKFIERDIRIADEPQIYYQVGDWIRFLKNIWKQDDLSEIPTESTDNYINF